MASNRVFMMAPALVNGPGAHHSLVPEGLGTGPGNKPSHALAMAPDFSRKRSSRPMMLPPFVVRLTHPASLVTYPTFPVTD